MIRRHSQSIRPPLRDEAPPTLLAMKLREAYQRKLREREEASG